jgi:phosphoglycerol transferase MdoB-like AlkP superfamily enzyme
MTSADETKSDLRPGLLERIRVFLDRRVGGMSMYTIAEWLIGAALVLILVFKLFYTRRYMLWRWDMTMTWRLETVFVIALIAILAVAFPRRRILAWSIAYVVSVTLMLVSVTYASYAGGILTLRDIVLADQVPQVWSSISGLLAAYWHRYAIDAAVILAGGIVLDRTLWRDRPVYRSRALWAVAIVSTLACGVLLGRAVTLPAGVDDIAAARYRGLIAWQIAANFRPEALMAPDEIPEDPIQTQAMIDEILDRTYGVRLVDFEPGVAAGKSVIVVQIEALQTFAIGLEIDGREITPNLNRLMQESYYFENAFAQVRKGTTADCEFITNSSCYAPYTAAAPAAYANHELTTLPRLLRETGYETVAFHVNWGAFWNRNAMMPAMGFNTLYEREYFGEEDQIVFGASDEVLWDKTNDVFLSLDASATPFYGYVITVSSHHPFNYLPDEKEPIELPAPYDDTKVENYLASIEYADRAFGTFLEEFYASGMADRVVLVVQGDHFGLRPAAQGSDEQAALDAAVGGRTYDLSDTMRVPLLVRLPGQTVGQVIGQPVGQIDIMPTIADVLGVDISATPHFGTSGFVEHSVLMQGTGLVTPGAYITGTTLVVPGIDIAGGTALDILTHEVVDVSTVDEVTLDHIRRLAAVSDAYVRSLPETAEGPLDDDVYLPK